MASIKYKSNFRDIEEEIVLEEEKLRRLMSAAHSNFSKLEEMEGRLPSSEKELMNLAHKIMANIKWRD